MADTIPAAVLKNTFSLGDFFRRVDIMQRFFEHFFFEATSLEGDRAQLLRTYYRDGDPETLTHANAVAAWGTDVLDTYTASNLYERVSEFKQTIRACPTLILYVPAHLSRIQIERISTWCRTNIKPTLILDLHIDPRVVGGCAFAYDNVYHDVSLTYFLKKQRAEILKLVRAYE